LLRKLRLQATDRQALLGGREADVMIEAKGKEHALSPMCVEIG